MFSSKGVYNIWLYIRSSIHLKTWNYFNLKIHFWVSEYDIRECSNFILLNIAVQFSQYHLLKRLSFLYHTFLLVVVSGIQMNWRPKCKGRIYKHP